MSVKISIIGAGGACFTMSFMQDICRSEHLTDCTVCLMDINEEKLNEAKALADRFIKEYGANVRLEATMSREEALRGAKYVINAALVIGNDKYKEGIAIGKKHGYRFGGSLHIMHDEAFYINFYQIRLMDEIVADMCKLCPDAYFLTVANPVQAGVTYLARKHPNMKIVGMCPGAYCFFTYNIQRMKIDHSKATYDFAGVNHFIWLTKFEYEGKDAMPLLDSFIEEDYASQPQYKNGRKQTMYETYRQHGMWPIGDTVTVGGGSWRWQYHTDTETEYQFNSPTDDVWEGYFKRCEQQIAFRKQLLEDKDLSVTEGKLPIELDKTVELIESIECDLGRVISVNVLNDKGYMKGLPTDYQTEINAVIDKDGIHPIPNEGLPKHIMALLYRDRIAPVEMELSAYASGNKEQLLELILMDPWTKSRPQAESFLDEILSLPWNKQMKEFFH